jgi:hypothetical protein
VGESVRVALAELVSEAVCEAVPDAEGVALLVELREGLPVPVAVAVGVGDAGRQGSATPPTAYAAGTADWSL